MESQTMRKLKTMFSVHILNCTFKAIKVIFYQKKKEPKASYKKIYEVKLRIFSKEKPQVHTGNVSTK